MTSKPPQAGRIRGPIHTWPITERPAVWVTVDGQRYAGQEHAHAEEGRARLVAWGQEYRWLRAADVEARNDDTPGFPQ